MRIIGLLAALLAAPLAAQSAGDVHRAEWEMLGIDDLRQGASGNPEDANAANSVEADVGDYTLPPLFENAAQQSEAGWRERRSAIARLVEDNWVGRIPEAVSRFAIVWTKQEIDSTSEHWVGQVIAPGGRMGPTIDATITFPGVVGPASISGHKPAPALIDYSYIWPPGFDLAALNGGATPPSNLAMTLDRGWAHVAYRPQMLQADGAADMAKGVIGLARWPRAQNDWGALRAWAWGASQLREELAQDPRIAANRISLSGHSRFGKGVLVAAAFDHDFADALVSSSGAGGSKIMRRDFGERWENMAGSGAFHWFTPNILRFAAGDTTVHDLPVDAHMLIALRAPRPLFITSGLAEAGDAWVDPAGMWTGFAQAQPVWEMLGASVPRTGMPVAQSLEQARYPLGWYQHGEGHVMWPAFPPFFDHAERFAED